MSKLRHFPNAVYPSSERPQPRLKFRAWPISEWSIGRHGHKIVYDKIGDAYDNDKLNDVLSNCMFHYTLMQHTGLKDRNGGEIYEGDVIAYLKEYRLKDGGVTRKEDINKRKVVEYKPISRNGIGFCIASETVTHSEVIGNIYENPELLQEGAN